MEKRLYKASDDRAISGVCAGIAQYFDVDVVIVRLLAVIFCFVSFGAALVVYIIAAIVIPEEPVVRRTGGTVSQGGVIPNNGFQGGTAAVGPGSRTEAGAGAGPGVEIRAGAENGDGKTVLVNGPEPAGMQGREPDRRKSSGSWALGILLIGAGAYLLVDWFFPWISWRVFAAVILIALGIVVLVRK